MTDQVTKNSRHQNCSICSQLDNYHSALQTIGREEEDTFIPEIAGSQKFVRSLKPESCRYMQLQVCPECQTYYLYKSDYEYLAFGTEDEQILIRLTDEEGAKYLEWPAE